MKNATGNILVVDYILYRAYFINQILSDETGKLLQRLSDINDGLNEWANNGGGGASSVAGQHTLQRHRDILQVHISFQMTEALKTVFIQDTPQNQIAICVQKKRMEIQNPM